MSPFSLSKKGNNEPVETDIECDEEIDVDLEDGDLDTRDRDGSGRKHGRPIAKIIPMAALGVLLFGTGVAVQHFNNTATPADLYLSASPGEPEYTTRRSKSRKSRKSRRSRKPKPAGDYDDERPAGDYDEDDSASMSMGMSDRLLNEFLKATDN